MKIIILVYDLKQDFFFFSVLQKTFQSLYLKEKSHDTSVKILSLPNEF
jgi:hypothetical protein